MTPAVGASEEASSEKRTEQSTLSHAVALAPHEFAANLIFVEAGLSPFFAADCQVTAADGRRQPDFRVDGECWQVTLYSQECGLVHPVRELPTGTGWEVERMREFRLSVNRHPEEDPIGQQRFEAHLAPRWQGMKGDSKTGRSSKSPFRPQSTRV